MKLSGKKVFITASGQGIGRAITERFIEEKATVFATDINYELINDIQCEKKELDVLNKSELQTSISSFNPDILINCAGFVHSGKILDAEDDQFDFAVSLNIKSMFHSIQAAIPLMIKKRGWINHKYFFGCFVYYWSSQSLYLWYNKSSSYWFNQICSSRLC